jgi:hypothetical protein
MLAVVVDVRFPDDSTDRAQDRGVTGHGIVEANVALTLKFAGVGILTGFGKIVFSSHSGPMSGTLDIARSIMSAIIKSTHLVQ